jgi:hypothetical protein
VKREGEEAGGARIGMRCWERGCRFFRDPRRKRSGRCFCERRTSACPLDLSDGALLTAGTRRTR